MGVDLKKYHKIYLGRNNPFLVYPTYNGTALTTEELAVVTRMDIKYKDTYISSALYPDLFDLVTYVADGAFSVNIAGLNLAVGADPDCEIILFSTDYPTVGRVAGPTLALEVTDELLGDAVLIDPIAANIALGDLNNVDDADATAAQVLTRMADGTYRFQTPVGGSGSANIDETLATDLSYSGPTSTITVGENVVFGDFLYKNLADGKYYKARANAVSTAPAMRMALATAAADAACLTLCPGGVVRNDAWAWTADGTILGLYLSAAVAGTLTEMPDTATNNVAQIVGIPTGANTLEFMPSLAIGRF